MKFLPPHWLSALRREMTPSWVGWILIAVLVALFIAWVRGVGADLFYPLQYAVAFWVLADLQLDLTVWLVMFASTGAYIGFGPVVVLIACGTALWSRHARAWPTWLLLAVGMSFWFVNSQLWRFVWRQRGGVPQEFTVLYHFGGWLAFFILAWCMTRSRWVVGSLVILWILQWEALWIGPVALRSVLWHAALFSVFLLWGINRRRKENSSLVRAAAQPSIEQARLQSGADPMPRTAMA